MNFLNLFRMMGNRYEVLINAYNHDWQSILIKFIVSVLYLLYCEIAHRIVDAYLLQS